MNLFHYTTIENLALILENKQIKFTRLDKLNDPLDGISEDFPASQKIAYVACFTKRQDDPLPMWSLYSAKFDGVRIEFSSNLFGDVENYFWNNQPAREFKKSYFNNNESTVIFGPLEIEYKPSKNEIKNKIIEEIYNAKIFYPLHIGKFKLEDWKFEDEIRFKILSFNALIGGKTENGEFERKLEQIDQYIYDNIEFILVDLKENIFDEITILLGPKVSKAQEIIINSLIEKYAPLAKITRSVKEIR